MPTDRKKGKAREVEKAKPRRRRSLQHT